MQPKQRLADRKRIRRKLHTHACIRQYKCGSLHMQIQISQRLLSNTSDYKHTHTHTYECTQTHGICRNCISQSNEGQRSTPTQAHILAYCCECCWAAAAERFNWKLNCLICNLPSVIYASRER